MYDDRVPKVFPLVVRGLTLREANRLLARPSGTIVESRVFSKNRGVVHVVARTPLQAIRRVESISPDLRVIAVKKSCALPYHILND